MAHGNDVDTDIWTYILYTRYNSVCQDHAERENESIDYLSVLLFLTFFSRISINGAKLAYSMKIKIDLYSLLTIG